jgi:ABC-type Fe3+/spermidine/putrescine transport system ATPase subunit
MATVELRNARRSYPTCEVRADLVVPSGARLVLLGPSGCGKTTVLRLVAGLEPLDGGDVVIDGASMASVRPEHRDTVMVFQDQALFPFHTVAENVGYGLQVRKVPEPERSDRIRRALASVRLEGYADRWPGDLSGGERQRVSLARALVVEPRVLLLDEPFNSLDPPLRRELQRLVCELHDRHPVTSIFVTHDHDEALAIGTHIAVMDDGHVRHVDAVDDVLTDAVDDRVGAFLRPRTTS